MEKIPGSTHTQKRKTKLAFLLQISNSTNLALLMSYLDEGYSQLYNEFNLSHGLPCWNPAQSKVRILVKFYSIDCKYNRIVRIYTFLFSLEITVATTLITLQKISGSLGLFGQQTFFLPSSCWFLGIFLQSKKQKPDMETIPVRPSVRQSIT